MKKMILSLAFLVSGLTWAQELPTLRFSTLENGYIPVGFDSNDNVQFVVEGVYRDTCSKPAGTRFKINPSSRTIELVSYEYRYQGPCLDVLVPHDEVINLGVMASGNYSVLQSGGKKLGLLNVTRATKTSPDDFLYAPISQAYLKSHNGQVTITISGVFTNSCMRLAQVNPQVQPRVIAVQPIAAIDQRPAGCVNGQYPFEHTFTINNVRSGRYLLHVRSLNGNAINTLYDIE
ncbi:MAG: hypothetical protein L6Q37_02740 [Bdellovibrionaceae bacterium]|nr:hypothetical protein [Pseudobdellovibrionaceae bacterium]NUM57752.1 hypothetical protein [Pseudobdellovibrionaceae bacterium]